MTNRIDVTYYSNGLRLLDGCDSDEAVKAVADASERALRERFEPEGFKVFFETAPAPESLMSTYRVDVELDDAEDFTTERDVKEIAIDLMERAASDAIGDAPWLD